MIASSSIDTYFAAPFSNLSARDLDPYMNETDITDLPRARIQQSLYSTAVRNSRKRTPCKIGLIDFDLSALRLSKPALLYV